MNWITMVGLTAAACTTISFLPQAIKTIKTKHTKDLSLVMYSILTTGILLWVVYGIFINNDKLVFIVNMVKNMPGYRLLALKL